MDVEDLSAIRQDIDKIDQELVRLLCQRMDCSRRVAETKRRQGLPILNQEREDAILDKVAAMARDWDTEGDGYDDVVRLIYGVTMDASRAVQHRRLAAGEGLRRHLAAAHRQLPASASARVVCAGCAGAYADEAAAACSPAAVPSSWRASPMCSVRCRRAGPISASYRWRTPLPVRSTRYTIW